MVIESRSSSEDCPRPLRLGVLALSKEDGRRVLAVAESVGWTAEYLDPSDPSRESWATLDLIVLCVGTIKTDVLALVTGASQDVVTRLLVIGRDKDPQHLADVLRSGAADYVVAPFAAEELLARIRALVTRLQSIPERRSASEFVFDPITRTVLAGSVQMSLSQREWDALNILLEEESNLVTVEALSQRLTGAPDNESIVISTISRLRRKIRLNQFFAISIDTIYGHGYVARFRRISDTFDNTGKFDGLSWG